MADAKLNMAMTEDRGKIIFKNNSSAEFDSTEEVLKLLQLINMGLVIMPKQITAMEDQKATMDQRIENIRADIADKEARKKVIEDFLASKSIDFNAELDKLANK